MFIFNNKRYIINNAMFECNDSKPFDDIVIVTQVSETVRITLISAEYLRP